MSNKISHIIGHNLNRIVGAAVVAAVTVALGAGANASYMQADPLYAARTNYSNETSNERLFQLINDYYRACSSNDIKGLKKFTKPISAMEKSYISFMSEYIDGYSVEEIYSKPGLDQGSHLVSVYVNVYFKGLAEPSPGLDFFYIYTDEEGELKIDNRYCAFNQLYGETDTDPDIQALYDEFEIQNDVNLLRIGVQNEYNALMDSDENFNMFINVTLPEAAKQWLADYRAAIEAEAAAEEEARLAAEAEAQRLAEEEAARVAAEEAERQKAEEMATAVQMITTSKVNIRDTPSEDSEAVGFADPDTVVVKYFDEGEWSAIDYYGEKKYIKSEFLRPYEEPAPEQ